MLSPVGLVLVGVSGRVESGRLLIFLLAAGRGGAENAHCQRAVQALLSPVKGGKRPILGRETAGGPEYYMGEARLGEVGPPGGEERLVALYAAGCGPLTGGDPVLV